MVKNQRIYEINNMLQWLTSLMSLFKKIYV